MIPMLEFQHPIYLLRFQMKPKQFGFQLRVGNWRFRQFTMGFITMTRFNSGFKLNPGFKPNLKPDQINWVQDTLDALSVCLNTYGLKTRTTYYYMYWVSIGG